jgi:hypothetical protein
MNLNLLKEVGTKLQLVKELVDAGSTLSIEEVVLLEQLSAQLRQLRDFSIQHDPISNREAAQRYGLTEARISQIRSVSK